MRFALVLLLAAARPIMAPVVHATLVSSEPAANGRLTASPARVRLVFSEPIEGNLARVTLVARSGATIRLRAAGDPRDVNAVIAKVDSTLAGGYRVDWRVVSADGHPVDGTYTFAVGDAALGGPPAAATDTTPAHVAPADSVPAADAAMEDEAWGPSVYGAPLIPALFRGAGLGALMALAGMLFFRMRGGPNAPQLGDPRVRAAITTAAGLSAVLLIGHALTWLVNTSPEHTLNAAWISAAVGTTVGQIEMWRVGLAVLALWSWWLARRPGLALVFALASLAVSGATGHSAAILPFMSVPAKAVHLIASAVWAGGLLWLVIRPREDTIEHFASDANRVSTAALIAVIAVAFTGVVQTVTFLPSIRDVLTSKYGWVALGKAAGLLVLVGFGAYNRQRVMPKIAAAREAGDVAQLSATVKREIVVMTLVILLGGLLAYVPPPEGSDMITSTHESPS
ncbi:MAG TPA: copper resistance protein CopC [Gemmatimonadaceae bacterium]|nr:copper resistance protein CopC [Gemmatimonadaceae bacterium]